MAGETPERDVILAILGRYQPGARGLTAVELAREIRAWPAAQGGNTRCTPAGMRRQLGQLATEGLVTSHGSGELRWAATGRGKAARRPPGPPTLAELAALARTVEELKATTEGLADAAAEFGRPDLARRLGEHSRTFHLTAARLHALARTVTEGQPA